MNPTGTPLFKNVGIIALVPDDWYGLWMPRHQILARLGKYFHVVWMNPVREWRDQWLHRPRNRACFTSAHPASYQISVLNAGRVFPKFYRPDFVAGFTESMRLQWAKKILLKKGCEKLILYIWRPEFFPTNVNIHFDLTCYHIDDEYTFSEVELPLQRQEETVIKNIDQVLIHSPGLLEKKGHLNPCTAYIPNGVDFEAFSTVHEEPEQLKKIPHPRIGYIGAIKKHLDYDLLIELAQRHNGWSFVFVGPLAQNMAGLQDKVQKLMTLSNVHFAGAKKVEDLPAYTQHTDVNILCYKLNGYTKFIYPLKLHEYLATGRPIVGSPIRTLLDFSDTIRIASTLDEWSEALSSSLMPNAVDPQEIEKRRQIAKGFDWNVIAGEIAEIFLERLESKCLRKLSRFMPIQEKEKGKKRGQIE